VCVGCGDAGGADEFVATAAQSVISDTAAEAVFYKNPDGQDGLPELVPVVISKKNDKPDVAFRLDCGSNFRPLLKGFGYSDNDPTSTFLKYPSLAVLQKTLNQRRGDGTNVPIVNLRCGATAEETRQQVAQVYRAVSVPPAPGSNDPLALQPGEYYLRLANDPATLYSVGCVDFLAALGVTDGTGSTLQDVSIPITRGVLESFTERRFGTREINCYAGTKLPSKSENVPLHAYDPGPKPNAELFLLSPNPFPEEIFSDDVLYMVSNGKGYAIDCGSNARGVKTALGFASDSPLAPLSSDDPRYVDSAPSQQPILRCARDRTVIYETWNEGAPGRYFHFNEDKALLRFRCDSAESFFTSGATTTRKLPKEALTHVLADVNDTQAQTNVLEVACGPLGVPRYVSEIWTTKEGVYWDAQHWFTGDFNGDNVAEVGKLFAHFGAVSADVHRSDGNRFVMEHWLMQSSHFYADSKWLTGDFNADGKSDLAAVFPEAGLTSIEIYISNGRTFNAAVRWATKQGAFNVKQRWLAADFNGDGADDLVKLFEDLATPQDQNQVSLDVYLSNKQSAFKTQRWATRFSASMTSDWLVGDFDADHRSDIAEVYPRNGFVRPFPNPGPFPPRPAQEIALSEESLDSLPAEEGIVEGPIRGPIIIRRPTFGINVHRSVDQSGSGKFVAQNWELSMTSPVVGQRWLAGDVDGDGKTDIVRVVKDGTAIGFDVHTSTGSTFKEQRLAMSQLGTWDDAYRWFADAYTGTHRTAFAKVRNQDSYGSIDVVRVR
jgi:hypothetical protein